MSPPTGYIQFSNPVINNFVSELPLVQTRYMRSLFTNNSQVYYKAHSLASGGVGTVRNSGRKAKRT